LGRESHLHVRRVLQLPAIRMMKTPEGSDLLRLAASLQTKVTSCTCASATQRANRTLLVIAALVNSCFRCDLSVRSGVQFSPRISVRKVETCPSKEEAGKEAQGNSGQVAGASRRVARQGCQCVLVLIMACYSSCQKFCPFARPASKKISRTAVPGGHCFSYRSRMTGTEAGPTDFRGTLFVIGHHFIHLLYVFWTPILCPTACKALKKGRRFNTI